MPAAVVLLLILDQSTSSLGTPSLIMLAALQRMVHFLYSWRSLVQQVSQPLA
jgi:hypothetical protein